MQYFQINSDWSLKGVSVIERLWSVTCNHQSPLWVWEFVSLNKILIWGRWPDSLQTWWFYSGVSLRSSSTVNAGKPPHDPGTMLNTSFESDSKGYNCFIKYSINLENKIHHYEWTVFLLIWICINNCKFHIWTTLMSNYCEWTNWPTFSILIIAGSRLYHNIYVIKISIRLWSFTEYFYHCTGWEHYLNQQQKGIILAYECVKKLLVSGHPHLPQFFLVNVDFLLGPRNGTSILLPCHTKIFSRLIKKYKENSPTYLPHFKWACN